VEPRLDIGKQRHRAEVAALRTHLAVRRSGYTIRAFTTTAPTHQSTGDISR